VTQEEAVWILTRIESKKHKNHCRNKCAPRLSCSHQNCLSGALRGQYSWSGCYSQTLVTHAKANINSNGASRGNLGLWTMGNMYCSLMSPPSLSFPHPREFRCGEAPKKLNTRTVAAKSEARQWISDGLGFNIMAFPIGPILVLNGPKTTNHSGGPCAHNGSNIVP